MDPWVRRDGLARPRSPAACIPELRTSVTSRESLARKQRYADGAAHGGRLRAGHRGWYGARTDKINARPRRWADDPAPRIKHHAYGSTHKRGYRLKYCYGMSLMDYDVLFRRQRGVCAICKRRSARTLCVDHCHATGKVRGLLCSKCNLGIGQLEDNPILVRAASAYLEASLGATIGNSFGSPRGGSFGDERVESRSGSCRRELKSQCGHVAISARAAVTA